MKNPFDSAEMAVGYARSRPAVHPRIVERAMGILRAPVGCVLDVGCGAGVSTRAIAGFAGMTVGVEPVAAMLPFAPAIAPGAYFVAGAAEQLPFGAGRFDLLTAAGSLNYVDLEAFWEEARRVLRPGGHLLVYDFKTARRFGDLDGGADALDGWFDGFLRRYPPVVSGRVQSLDPERLARLARGFTRVGSESTEIGLEVEPEFYLEYLLTGTNVAQAVANGAALASIREWCHEGLSAIWQGRARTVLFDAYWVLLRTAI